MLGNTIHVMHLWPVVIFSKVTNARFFIQILATHTNNWMIQVEREEKNRITYAFSFALIGIDGRSSIRV